jgi:predicted DNA-binding transcriptional regulator YafY
MRADRLISIILLLRESSPRSAARLARELEVSVRTIFRDIDSLCAAGVPIYSEAGRNGGYSLLDDYRVDLTGLNADELLGLFLSGRSDIAGRLGLEAETGQAVRKLTSALPEIQRRRLRWYQERIFVDSAEHPRNGVRSYDPDGSVDLSLLCRAVLESITIELRIVWPRPDQAGEYRVAPVGLVESEGSWYLIAQLESFIRVYPVAAISSARLTDSTFERPEGFDLAEYWRRWKLGMKRFDHGFVADLAISPAVTYALETVVREEVRPLLEWGERDEEGRVAIRVTFSHFDPARAFVLAHGRAVRVIGPESLRRSVVSYAEETIALNGSMQSKSG